MQAKKTKVSIIIAREQRRRQVAEFLQQSMTEAEIAQRLNVDPSTICRDVQALKEAANDDCTKASTTDILKAKNAVGYPML
ncbi:MAG: HTH domain-containing protein [Nitrososphaeraceae archaeon]